MHIAVYQLRDRNLSRVGPLWLIIDILRGHLHILSKRVASDDQVDGGRSDNDLDIGVQVGIIEHRHNLLDGLGAAVPGALVRSEVSRNSRDLHFVVGGDEEFARHVEKL